MCKAQIQEVESGRREEGGEASGARVREQIYLRVELGDALAPRERPVEGDDICVELVPRLGNRQPSALLEEDLNAVSALDAREAGPVEVHDVGGLVAHAAGGQWREGGEGGGGEKRRSERASVRSDSKQAWGA